VKPFVFHPEARQELTAAGRHFAERGTGLAQRFYTEIEGVIAEVCARPTLRRVFDPPARRHFGAIFPYAIVYVDRSEEVWIVAVMHFKQRPGYWRERLA